IFNNGTARIHLIKFFEERLYIPVAYAVGLISSQVSRMQNGKLDTYVLYVFIAVLTLMTFTRYFA
ncbi:MAG TPA: hypothetical protein PKJ75_08085, partial [Methanosarcina vacuolata]|nr:hypothetical protein [Methanosarcina vacuolata]